jgi:hypothetical protein
MVRGVGISFTPLRQQREMQTLGFGQKPRQLTIARS